MPVIDKGEFTVVVPHMQGRMGGIVHIITRKVKSGNVDWIGWPRSGEHLLIVQFKGGGRYAYIGVSRQRAVACANSPSTGAYINKHIKPNHTVYKLR